MNIEKQEKQFKVESNGKTFTIPFISNVIFEGEAEYCVAEITWDEEPSKSALELIEKLSAPILKKK